MKILKLTKSNYDEIVKETLKVLQGGGLVVYPTETCYGLGADATSKIAIAKLYKYKTRREGKPFSIAVSGLNMAKKYVEINELARNLYKNYLPGPLTVVSNGLQKVADGVESEYKTLGIRWCDYNLVQQIVEKFGKPITSTSANVSYKKKPYSIEALKKDTPEKSWNLIDLIIDTGSLPNRPVSTVVDTTLNNLNIMRVGAVSLQKEIKEENIILQADTASDLKTVDFGSMVMLKYIDEIQKSALIFALIGELGAGKTQFAKGIGRYLGIKKIITSPTYTFSSEYKFKIASIEGLFAHIDTWRLGSAEELRYIGLENYVKPHNVIAIEWADKYFDKLKKLLSKFNHKLIIVKFEYINESERKIKVYE